MFFKFSCLLFFLFFLKSKKTVLKSVARRALGFIALYIYIYSQKNNFGLMSESHIFKEKESIYDDL